MIVLAAKETPATAPVDKDSSVVKCRNCNDNVDRESAKVGWNGFLFCTDGCKETFGHSILKA